MDVAREATRVQLSLRNKQQLNKHEGARRRCKTMMWYANYNAAMDQGCVVTKEVVISLDDDPR